MSVPLNNTSLPPREGSHLALRGAHFLVELLSSYGLASALFVGLLLLTYLGTIAQVEHGLFHAQQKYFHAFVVVQQVGPVALFLPGAYLLMVLLFVNILLGAMLRIRRGWAQLGMFMVHGGIVVLLLGAFVSHHYAFDGTMTLREGEVAGHFTSADAWEVTVESPLSEGATSHLLRSGVTQEVSLAGFPASLVLHDFQANAALSPAGPMFTPPTPVVDGYFLEPLPIAKYTSEAYAGVYVRIVPSDGSASREVILWALQREPVVVELPEGSLKLTLRRQQHALPFQLSLDKFERSVHPGTATPRAFSSEITRIDGDIRERVVIGMNSPMRYKGYTFYQSSWGPQDAAPGVPLHTVLAVSRNPADRFPLYACTIIALGMALHFALKLSRYIRRESARGDA